MGKIAIGLNLEFTKEGDKSMEWGIDKAAELGYEYVEPMVHTGRGVMSEHGYLHSVSLSDDPLRIKRACERAGVKPSALSCHSCLCKPDVSLDYIKQSIRFAFECGAPLVCTDEGPKPPWTTEEEDFVLMRYTLQELAFSAEPRNIKIGLEQHQQYSSTPAGLDRMLNLVDSPAIGVNFDVGNAYLAGEDIYEWLGGIKDRIVHIHGKDISMEHSDAERGKVTGTPVGCALGEGVLDWKEIVRILKQSKNDIVISNECGTLDQAERSLPYLKSLL